MVHYTLITNLDQIYLNSMVLHCYALLIEKPDSGKYTIRGFGTEGAWPVFEIEVENADYHLSDKTLSSDTHDLHFTNGPELNLVLADRDAPLRTDIFEGQESNDPIMRVWTILPRRVRQFWGKGTNMPSLTWSKVS